MSATTKPSSGWNRSSSTPKPAQKKPSAVRGIVAGIVVVLLALAGAWFFLGDSLTSTAPKDKKTKTIKEVKPVKISMKTNAVERIASKPTSVSKANRSVDDQPARQPTQTNDTTVATNKPKKVKRVFKSQMEMFLNMAIPTKPGERMPPVPIPDFDENADEETQIESVKAELADIEKGFKNELKIKEGDSDALAERKAIVTDAKAEFKELMKEGMTLKQYIKALQDKFNADADFVGEAQKMVDANYNDQTLSNEDYQKLKAKVDKLLEDRGLPATEDEDTIAAKEAEEEQVKKEQEKKQ